MEISKKDYIGKVLDAYRLSPETTGAVRRNDRLLAASLYDRGVPLPAVENALTLATARRIVRSPGLPPLQPIRSLHYLLPIIAEVLDVHVSPDFYRDLQFNIDQVVNLKKLIRQLPDSG